MDISDEASAGDHIGADIGEGSQNIAVGKNINQVYAYNYFANSSRTVEHGHILAYLERLKLGTPPPDDFTQAQEKLWFTKFYAHRADAIKTGQ